ncbi:MAG: mercury methylation corrinoid protein HgcA [Candidatus Ozemobacteraceae bacterium]
MSDVNLPHVDGSWSLADWWGAVMVRCKYGRDHYRVEPGLYRSGSPTADSPVLVTSNYKLTFDLLRSDVAHIDTWILALETHGINVWCAAGKGTFSTDELVRRIGIVELPRHVTHRTVILPQLGASGIAAHEVTRQIGFRVVYGPVRSRDIPAFLAADMKATPPMREVTFDLGERLLVTPVELIGALPHIATLFVALIIASVLRGIPLPPLLRRYWLPSSSAVVVGCIGMPALFPLLPSRAFALKGWFLGMVTTLLFVAKFAGNFCVSVGHLLLQPCIAAYYSLNYTGASPIASESGVKHEIARYVPPMKVLAALGLVFLGYDFLQNEKRN